MQYDPEPPTIDVLNRIANRQVTQAMTLFHRIMDDLDISGFSLEDVTDNYNTGTKRLGKMDEKEFKTERVRFGKSHLDTLVGLGLLGYDEKTGLYDVQTNSSYIACWVMGDDFLRESIDPFFLSFIPIGPDDSQD